MNHYLCDNETVVIYCCMAVWKVAMKVIGKTHWHAGWGGLRGHWPPRMNFKGD